MKALLTLKAPMSELIQKMGMYDFGNIVSVKNEIIVWSDFKTLEDARVYMAYDLLYPENYPLFFSDTVYREKRNSLKVGRVQIDILVNKERVSFLNYLKSLKQRVE